MEKSYRSDGEWIAKVRRWHVQFGLPLPPTFPNDENLRDAACDMYAALSEALPLIQTEIFQAQAAYGKNHIPGRAEKLQKVYAKGLAAIARATGEF